MYISRNEVISLLDKDDSKYDSNLVIVNMLPEDTVFEVVVEDIVTAEYYDNEKDIMYQLPLAYDYNVYGNTSFEVEKGKMDKEIASIDYESYNSSNITTNGTTSNLFIKCISLSIISAIIIIFYYFIK